MAGGGPGTPYAEVNRIVTRHGHSSSLTIDLHLWKVSGLNVAGLYALRHCHLTVGLRFLVADWLNGLARIGGITPQINNVGIAPE